jgi:hypothetical protein
MDAVTPAEEAKGETPIYRTAGMKATGNAFLYLITYLLA